MLPLPLLMVVWMLLMVVVWVSGLLLVQNS
jgi:hypothetical protein